MGNYSSCTTSASVSKSSIRGTKVIFPSGETRRLYEPTKAAELMLENPNSFIVSTKSLQIGRRFSALNADEDFEIGGVYVFFPMARLKSVVTEADTSVAADSATKKVSGVLPERGGNVPVVAPKLNLDDIEELLTPEFKHRLSMCRSKKPLLQTIVEESVYLR